MLFRSGKDYEINVQTCFNDNYEIGAKNFPLRCQKCAFPLNLHELKKSKRSDFFKKRSLMFGHFRDFSLKSANSTELVEIRILTKI